MTIYEVKRIHLEAFPYSQFFSRSTMDEANSTYQARCATCRFWHPINKETGTGWCEKITMGGTAILHGAVIEANAEDDQGLDASLITTKNFGCYLYS